MPRKQKVKTLVIPDLHCRHHRVEEIIAAVNPKTTVFLGDYFDKFHDTPEMNAATAKWLHRSIRTPGRVHLLGNHDLGYAYDQPRLQVPRHGWSRKKFDAINQHMTDLDWAVMSVFYTGEREFILSHAGLQISHIPPMLDLDTLPQWIADQEHDFFETMKLGLDHWFLDRGPVRGGQHNFGGPFWADFKEHQVIPGWHQVVGHTPKNTVRVIGDEDGSVTCLDTMMEHDKYPEFLGIFGKEFDVQCAVDLLGESV